jgi:hypothetical protein
MAQFGKRQNELFLIFFCRAKGVPKMPIWVEDAHITNVGPLGLFWHLRPGEGLAWIARKSGWPGSRGRRVGSRPPWIRSCVPSLAGGSPPYREENCKLRNGHFKLQIEAEDIWPKFAICIFQLPICNLPRRASKAGLRRAVFRQIDQPAAAFAGDGTAAVQFGRHVRRELN